jgi:predicted nucleic acid-binding protein
VVAEACFLLARSGFDPALPLVFIERGVVQLPFSLQEHISTVQQLFRRYSNVPASLADASLIRLSELIDPCQLLTLDSDFTVYRRHGRRLIPLICPE